MDALPANLSPSPRSVSPDLTDPSQPFYAVPNDGGIEFAIQRTERVDPRDTVIFIPASESSSPRHTRPSTALQLVDLAVAQTRIVASVRCLFAIRSILGKSVVGEVALHPDHQATLVPRQCIDVILVGGNPVTFAAEPAHLLPDLPIESPELRPRTPDLDPRIQIAILLVRQQCVDPPKPRSQPHTSLGRKISVWPRSENPLTTDLPPDTARKSPHLGLIRTNACVKIALEPRQGTGSLLTA